MNERERIARIIEYCGNKSRFAERMGMSPTATSNYIKRGTFDPLRINKAFPELSLDWLVRGVGPMFESEKEGDINYAMSLLGITQEQLTLLRSIPTAQEAAQVADQSSTQYATSATITIPSSLLETLSQQLLAKDLQISHLNEQVQARDRQIQALIDKFITPPSAPES